MTRPAAPEGYMHADAAAALLGVSITRVYQLSKTQGWGRLRQGRHGWAYVAEQVRTTERNRRS